MIFMGMNASCFGNIMKKSGGGDFRKIKGATRLDQRSGDTYRYPFHHNTVSDNVGERSLLLQQRKTFLPAKDGCLFRNDGGLLCQAFQRWMIPDSVPAKEWCYAYPKAKAKNKERPFGAGSAVTVLESPDLKKGYHARQKPANAHRSGPQRIAAGLPHQKKEGHGGLLLCRFGRKERADYRLEY